MERGRPALSAGLEKNRYQTLHPWAEEGQDRELTPHCSAKRVKDGGRKWSPPGESVKNHGQIVNAKAGQPPTSRRIPSVTSQARSICGYRGPGSRNLAPPWEHRAPASPCLPYREKRRFFPVPGAHSLRNTFPPPCSEDQARGDAARPFAPAAGEALAGAAQSDRMRGSRGIRNEQAPKSGSLGAVIRAIPSGKEAANPPSQSASSAR